jgi:hypothetical protein
MYAFCLHCSALYIELTVSGWQVDSMKLKQHVRCWVLYVIARSIDNSTEILTLPICGNVHQYNTSTYTRLYIISLNSRLRCRLKQRSLLGLPWNGQTTFKNIYSVKSTFIPSVTIDVFERDRKHLMVNARWNASPRRPFPLHLQASL